METMILVAGLALVGLAGIAAAFYFSMRPGGSRARTAPRSRILGLARAGDSRRPASRSRTARPPRSGSGPAVDRTGPSGSSTVIDFTGPQRALEDPEPAVTGRRAQRGYTDTGDSAGSPKSHRRVGWRKGSDVDEELWPAEAFGGVSDEQFWDDMAADRPLATTARTAQPDAVAKRRLPNSGPLPDLRPAGGRGRVDGRHDPADGPGTDPQPRLGPDDQTAIQPAQSGSKPSPLPAQPLPAQPLPAQPVRAAYQPTEPRGRSRASAEEDPLTSPAYSLRARGSVDGRSYSSSRRSGDFTRGQYEAAAGQPTETFSLADAQAAGGGYPGGVPAYRQSDGPSHGPNGGRGRSGARRSDPLRPDGYRSDPPRSDPLRADPLRADPLRPDDGYRGTVPDTAYPYPPQPYGQPTQAMNTPPYGGRHGSGSPVGQAGGNGDGSWGSRPAYPPVNGSRGAYDPRGYDRRLNPPGMTSGFA